MSVIELKNIKRGLVIDGELYELVKRGNECNLCDLHDRCNDSSICLCNVFRTKEFAPFFCRFEKYIDPETKEIIDRV